MALPFKPREKTLLAGFNQRGPVAVTPERIREVEQALAALEDRKTGMQWITIAKKHGYPSATSAERTVHRLLVAMINPEDVHTAVLEDLVRLDALMEAIWPLATGGDLFAVDRILAIMLRRAKLIGLDHAPKGGVKAAAKDRTVKVTLQMGKTLSTLNKEEDEPEETEVEVTEKDLTKLKTIPGTIVDN